LNAAVLTYSVVCVFLAAIVRGYSGFGFSLLAITALSLVLSPAEIVPSIFMLEIAASLHLLPGIWRDIHWRSLAPLIIGCLIATPVGVRALASVPAAPMQVALAVLVIGTTALLWCGFALKQTPGNAGSVAVGAASGLLNGAFGIGGPPVILFYFSTPEGHVVGRASIIAYFLATDTIGLALLTHEGLVTWETLYRAAIFAIPLAVGVWLGARSFKTADPSMFRRIVLVLLFILAGLTATKGVYAILQ
jgi:uncharacterized membrane protein YfcA